MKVCLYGSGSKRTPSEFTDVGYELGLKIALNNHSLVFGGGNDGMMGAVAKGVYDNGGKITSISPWWINEFDDPFDDYDECIKTDSMDERKKLFLEKSDVFIIVPGGIGTLDEFFEVLTLKYLNRHSKKIILFNINQFYDKMIDMLHQMHDEGLIREGALDIFVVANSMDEVFEFIQ
ncbi:MAG: TIGR00730 family Rossman fold protein [Methanobrevibacter sp.]|nr:TIGR00730 family Rossman fold protein [Methanobrevibacter sp.]